MNRLPEKISLLALSFFLFFSSSVFAQETEIKQYVLRNYEDQNWQNTDLDNLELASEAPSKANGVTHYYYQQQVNGIPIENTNSTFSLNQKNEVLHAALRFVPQLKTKTVSTSFAVSATDALSQAALQLGLNGEPGSLLKTEGNASFYAGGSLSQEPIEIRKAYWHKEGNIFPVYLISIYTLDGKHWWQLVLNATNQEELERIDWVVSCDFGEHNHNATCYSPGKKSSAKAFGNLQAKASTAQYRVFAMPAESPNHGPHVLTSGEEDSLASPFGWHDVDGVDGADFTITRGNNVYAYDDIDDDNAPGFSPDGGSALLFDFPYTDSLGPNSYLSAATTNLFYTNNIMHDVFYHYGFDEASGNFQENNYNRGGIAGDYVNAEAQDGGGTNNANFATPPDGNTPRMQMYLWPNGGGSSNILTINHPSALAGQYQATGASFGPGIPSIPLTADLILAEDANAPVNDGCDPFVNDSLMAGKIVVIDRGNCPFVDKVKAAQNAGAVGVIIVNNVASAPINMGGSDPTITIPSIMVFQSDGNAIKTALDVDSVSVTISDGGAGALTKDGSFDNGIIAHEYGHGISIRLTGGASTSNCLNNAEQMGEGWSDWFGLMITIEAGDSGADRRGIGTFAINESTTGTGIRPAPYSTDMSINPYTYAASNDAVNISEPHGVGFIYCTALWDLTWALIDFYGGTPDLDLINGSGGNNVAMDLVMESLKLQPCSPGMLDGRDAILAADQLLYNGAHECLIWETFARRGFGWSASQGSSNSRSDQVEAFDVPPTCLTALVPPNADFSSSNSEQTLCDLEVSFEDLSTDIPQAWFWDFGDGNTSTDREPTHVYAQEGTYTVKLVVTNTLGSDSLTQTVTIDLPDTPTADDVSVCDGQTAKVIAQNFTGTVQWRNANGQSVANGEELLVENVNGNETYLVQQLIGDTATFRGGPVDGTIGTGGYHISAYFGALNFLANSPFEIVSVWVDADGAGPRTFQIGEGFNTDGAPPANVVDEVTVFLEDGPQRVFLNMEVPESGVYHIGGSNVNLFRNSDGPSFPYNIGTQMIINSSSASTSPTGYYYYFYDIEIRDLQCASQFDTVEVSSIPGEIQYNANWLTHQFQGISSVGNSWLWDFGDGNTSNVQNPTHAFAQEGFYWVTLSINNGDCIVGQEVNVGPVSTEEVSIESFDITLFPNPVSDKIQLTASKIVNENVTYEVLSIEGKLISSGVLEKGSSNYVINAADVAVGQYFLRLETDNDQIQKRFTVLR